jgi:LysM repeat protein
MRNTLTFGIAVALTLAVAAPARAEGPIVHIVQPGENLFRIALRYNLTVDALATANGLSNASRIYTGQRLVIPASGSATSQTKPSSGAHIVQPGENLFRIALRYGITTQTLAAANGIANTSRIYAGQRLVIPGRGTAPTAPGQQAPSGRTYVVRRGDKLSAIARQYGVSVSALAQANGIRNPSLIYAGQVLHIPQSGNSAPPASSPAHSSGRWIDVNLSTQRLTAYEGSTPVRSTLVSTGLPGTRTPTGEYRIYVKYTSTAMSGPGYYLPNVPYTMYFHRGYGLHGTYWHANFGRPMSHGCINLPTPEAQWIYNWAPIGTPVKIHY